MLISIRAKSAYGRTIFYPVCNNARFFADLTKKQTLTPNDLEIIAKLGIGITVEGASTSWRDYV